MMWIWAKWHQPTLDWCLNYARLVGSRFIFFWLDVWQLNSTSLSLSLSLSLPLSLFHFHHIVLQTFICLSYCHASKWLSDGANWTRTPKVMRVSWNVSWHCAITVGEEQKWNNWLKCHLSLIHIDRWHERTDLINIDIINCIEKSIVFFHFFWHTQIKREERQQQK